MRDGGTTLHLITANQRRGAEVFATDLVTALNARDAPPVAAEPALELPVSASPRHTVLALTPGPSGDDLGVESLGVSPFSPATLRALRRASKSVGAVVAHGSKTLPAAAVASRAPFVYRSIGDPRAWSGRGMKRWRTAFLLRRASRVVALWPGAADTLAELHGVPLSKLAVIPNGVPASRFPVADRKAQDAARDLLGLPRGEQVVTYLGALSPEKEVATAIDAVGRLGDVHLLIAGAGPARSALGVHASGAAPGKVHFVGRVDRPQDALAAADVVVLPSRTEGMPGVLIEAGLTGRASVASDVGGVSEIVRHGETGMLAPPSDIPAFVSALRTVLADARVFGEAAHKHCTANFDIPIVATQWAALLEDHAQ
jgi:glycosyltransferase involved in cell wall biosynthesis